MEYKKISLSDMDKDDSDIMNHLEKRWEDEGYAKRLEEIIAQTTAMRKKIYGSEEE